ncbi:MAG: type IX secretion system membrane protein PorP/SprF [Bacteroidetes bacterium]|nr:type IX secretion system membrane protein PorP/SprF [Bacteroidota bacterium]
MANKSFILTFLALITSMQMSYSQDPEFSQFYANPLYLNPALAGATVCPLLTANFRDQWPALGGAYVTYNASYDQYVDALHGGLGLLITADRTGGGKLNTTEISLIYAYKFNITDKLAASTALQVGYYQRHLSWDNLVFEDMIDPRLGVVQPTKESAPDNPTVGAPDFGAGVMLGYNERYYGGVAVSHLSQPKFGFYSDNTSRLEMKITAHAGAVINLKEGGGGFSDEREFSISPNILYQQQFKFHQLNIGTYLTIDPLIIGVWFRHNFENADAIVPMLGVHYKSFRFGFTYDVTISRLKGSTGGAYEASASWQFPCIEKRRHIRAIKCPRF